MLLESRAWNISLSQVGHAGVASPHQSKNCPSIFQGMPLSMLSVLASAQEKHYPLRRNLVFSPVELFFFSLKLFLVSCIEDQVFIVEIVYSE